MSKTNDIISTSKNTYFLNFKIDIFSSSGEEFQWERFAGHYKTINFILQ